MNERVEWERRLRVKMSETQRGTLAAFDYFITAAIEENAPLCVTSEMVKPRIARLWLRQEKPKGLFARLRWWWRLWREL